MDKASKRRNDKFMNAKQILMAAAVAVGMAQAAWAVPFLQLDASPSKYNVGNEDIEASANPFTLYALVNSAGKDFSLAGTYYISAAIVKHDAPPSTGYGGTTATDSSFGSFKIGLVEYNFGSMKYGTPPIEANLTHQAQDLPTHGVYDTLFIQLPFNLDSSKRASEYNTADSPGGLTPNSSGSLYYQDWKIDVTGLTAGYDVHFDLFTVIAPVWHPEVVVPPQYKPNGQLKKAGYTIPGYWTPGEGDFQIGEKAPFSHDAISGPHTSDNPPVPDGGMTVMLLGMAMAGLGFLRRKF